MAYLSKDSLVGSFAGVVLHVAEVLYVHLRRRTFSVREEEHCGQGHPQVGEAGAVDDAAPWLLCSAAMDSKGLMGLSEVRPY